MRITLHEKAGTMILTLVGRMDFQARQSFHQAMQKASLAQPKHVILNLSQVPYIDSAGIGLLMLAYKKMEKDNIHLSLEVSKGYVLDVLTLTKIGSTIALSVTEAQLPHNVTFNPRTT